MKLSPCDAEMLASLVLESGCVLEIGYGDGALLTHLQRTGNYTLYGISPEAKAVPGVFTTTGCAEQLCYPDQFFDCVILECVFSLCDPEQAVQEIARVLRPGGILLLADLYTNGAELVLQHSPEIKNLYGGERLESFFCPYFSLERFTNYSRELRQMFLRMIWEGTVCTCMDPRDASVLKQAKVNYGCWKWKKN